MSWEFKYKRDAYRFLEQRNLLNEFEKTIASFIKKEEGADIKKLHGEYKGSYRLRIGKIRIIFKIDFEGQIIYVKKADFRGGIYK
jgi:mRNA interferase RelE/StbE